MRGLALVAASGGYSLVVVLGLLILVAPLVVDHPVLLPGKSHGRRNLVGCSPRGRKESDTTERLPFHFSLSCIGEGNGNPLQCSCLENPRDGGAWWVAVYGVAQSRTRLKRLSSSSLWWIMGSRHMNFSSCNAWALELGLSACGPRA